MIKLAVYDPITGEILRTVQCSEEDAQLQKQEGEEIIFYGDQDVDDLTHYVEQGFLSEKTPFRYDTKWDDMTMTITGLPEGVKVSWQEFEVITDGGPTEIEFEVPDYYQLSLSGSVAHLDDIIEVNLNGQAADFPFPRPE